MRLVQEQVPGHVSSWIPGESLEAGSTGLGDWDTAKAAEGPRGSSVRAVWVTRGRDASLLEQESGCVPERWSAGEGRGCLGRKSPLPAGQGDTQKAARFFSLKLGQAVGCWETE